LELNSLEYQSALDVNLSSLRVAISIGVYRRGYQILGVKSCVYLLVLGVYRPWVLRRGCIAINLGCQVLGVKLRWLEIVLGCQVFSIKSWDYTVK